jgi:hypothetical protein
VDVERARRSPTYFEEAGERRWFLLEHMTSISAARLPMIISVSESSGCGPFFL